MSETSVETDLGREPTPDELAQLEAEAEGILVDAAIDDEADDESFAQDEYVPPERVNWRTFALCKGAPSEIFFPDVTRGQVRAYEIARALSICAMCSVVDQCYEDAVANGEKHGIWGGVDFGNRRTRPKRS